VLKKQKIKIGNIKLKNNIIFAPMAGITDLPVRILAAKGGAGLVCTEMVSAKGLVHIDAKTKKLLVSNKKEKPVAAQIFGGDAQSMGEAAKIVSDMGFDVIDVNLGCPVRKIAKAGAGAKLLADKTRTEEILAAVVNNSGKTPVTAKIRIGLVPGHNIAPEIIEIAQNCGVKAVAVHARYASQGHTGEPDIEAFKEACIDAKIPIFANGGIINEETAERFMSVKGCSGLMIGRGAVGNYNIFDRLAYYFKTGKKKPEPSVKDKIKWLKEHAKDSVKQYGEKKGLILLRKTIHYYVKDMPNAAKLRSAFNKIVTVKEFEETLKIITSDE